jgi:hypothetical protein
VGLTRHQGELRVHVACSRCGASGLLRKEYTTPQALKWAAEPESWVGIDASRVESFLYEHLERVLGDEDGWWWLESSDGDDFERCSPLFRSRAEVEAWADGRDYGHATHAGDHAEIRRLKEKAEAREEAQSREARERAEAEHSKKYKRYVFNIETTGYGYSVEEAWADCCDTILSQWSEFSDPEDIPEVTDVSQEDDDMDDEDAEEDGNG